MKKINSLKVIALLFISFLFTSCETIGSIFKAGMGFGIIIVIAVLVVLVFVISKFTKK